ncbi:hypothetical protein [Nocardia nova]
MSLGVSAYETVALLPEHGGFDQCEAERHQFAYTPAVFHRSAVGLVSGRCYAASGRELFFDAGPCSVYGRFREELCRAALDVDPEVIWDDPDAWADKPFFELIHFGDNEGAIGPVASADLADDFATHRDTVCAQLDADHAREYDEWATMFQLAAGTGMVVFA